jgi:hypothetical protein
MTDPTAAPIWTIGPSRPAEPPVPTVAAVARIFSGMTRPRILPLCTSRAATASGTPSPETSGANLRARNQANRKPVGTVRKIQGCPWSIAKGRKNSSNQSTR